METLEDFTFLHPHRLENDDSYEHGKRARFLHDGILVLIEIDSFHLVSFRTDGSLNSLVPDNIY